MNKKFRINLKYIIFVLIIGIWFYSLSEPLYTPTALPVSKDHYHFPEIVAHLPDNSLSAIQQTLASTVDGMEVDIRISKDGVLFLYHGETLDEYTDHKGEPENYNWSYLAQVKYKNTEEKLMLLDDFLQIVGNQKVIFLKSKSKNAIDKQMAHLIVDHIKKYKLQDNIFVESFNPITLGLIRLYSRYIMLMYNFVDNDKSFNNMPWLLKQHWVQKQVRRIIRPDVLGAQFNLAPHIFKKLVVHGYPIISWNVDDPNIAKSLYKAGVKGLVSNKPQLIENIIIRKNKTILDAGGTTAVVHEIIKISNVADIQKSIIKAKQEAKVINVGGRRHSMGGQTLYDQSIFLNMLKLDQVAYNPDTKTVTAQAGATWKKIQEVLALHGRSVKVMQSDNIFSVGGSISVNVHGWQVGAPPIASTILKMTVITADGKVHEVSSTVNTELFNAIIGGYGMFAIIVDAELATTPNSMGELRALFTDIENFDRVYTENISDNKKVELAYARLSMDQDNLLNKVGLFWFETKDEEVSKDETKPEGLIAVKRSIFRLSEYYDFGKKLRWQAEKAYAENLTKNHETLSRNDVMNADIHILWPLYGSNKDILHEYFIPKNHVHQFIGKLKDNVYKHNINILNVTIREVKKDNISLLAYAREDVYGLVCLFSQGKEAEDEEKMKSFTQAVIDDAISLGGTFYLPYRLHYDAKQMLAAYPQIKDWINVKKKYDPDMIFQSQFFHHINKNY